MKLLIILFKLILDEFDLLFACFKGEIEKAERYYSIALQLEPNNRLVVENLTKLKRARRTTKMEQTTNANRSTVSAQEYRKKSSNRDRPQQGVRHYLAPSNFRPTNRYQTEVKLYQLTDNNHSFPDWGHIDSRAYGVMSEATII